MHVILLKDINGSLATYLEGGTNNAAGDGPLWKYHGVYRLWYSTESLSAAQITTANTNVGARGVVVPIERVNFDRHIPLR